MKNILIYLFFLVISSDLMAQSNPDAKRDYQWLFGYRQNKIGANLMDFNDSKIKMDSIKPNKLHSAETLAQICDENGKLLFYTNGCSIRDKNYNIMQNGDTLNKSNYWNLFCADDGEGLRIPQGAIAIPKPSSTTEYYLFHETLDPTYQFIPGIMFSLIDMSKNNGAGAVMLKNKTILKDTMGDGKIAAVRHANGKDWWITAPRYTPKGSNKNGFYTFLLTKDSISTPEYQAVADFPAKHDFYGSEVAFSPDGTKYAHYLYNNALMVYDFDRSTGLFSNFRFEKLSSRGERGGCVFSANSRFLYVPSDTLLYQVDMQSKDLESGTSIVATYDGFKNNKVFVTAFCYAHLAPDCKIYVTTIGTTPYLHTINYPDRKGEACNVVQRSIKLPTYNAFSLPNYPNFRLGKLGEPYRVCDSTVNAYTTSSGELKEQPITANLYPNPAASDINLDLFGYINQYKKGIFNLYDTQGNLAITYPLLQNQDEYRFDISNLANGMYFWHLVLDDKIRQTGKVVVMNE